MSTLSRVRVHRRPVAATLMAIAAVLLPIAVSAHPLGNFTINRFDGIRVSPTGVVIDHVLDMAEIPTFSERADMDTDGNGSVSDAEAATYAVSHCDSTIASLNLAVGAMSLNLTTTARGIQFPQGQGAVTMRLVCTYAAALAAPLAAGTAFSFSDNLYGDRRGWREVVVQGDGATLLNADAPAATVSQRLTVYPTDLLAIPLNQFQATWSAQPGGPALAPLSVPDAQPITANQPAPVGGTTVQPPAPSATQPATNSAPTAAVPNGVTDLGADVTALFQTESLTPWVIALSLLVAAGLGALHALSPGHGKTVMAAYLVGSRGNARQALGLGMMVTVSHTIGVLALGLLTLSFSAFIPVDRLYPILGVVSGTVVVCIGIWLISQRIAEVRRNKAAARGEAAHSEAHANGLDHEHPHASAATETHAHPHADEHGHDHPHADEHEHGHDHADAEDGYHSHGGRRHTHLPPKGTTLSRRGLITLGVAGGMVPSISALIVLLGALAAGRPAYGIVLTIAFGVGMAVVLVGVGLGLVYARGFVERFSGGSRAGLLSKWLPTATGFVVLGAGALMTVQAIALAR
jgi:nickel/cobalt transporter (NicO) family protein